MRCLFRASPTLLMMLVCSPFLAAVDYPIVEFSGGVSYAHMDLDVPANMVGWHITFGMNPRSWLRLLGDFSEQQVQSSTIHFYNARSTVKDYQFVWGPQFVFRRSERFIPFAHALFGVAARHYSYKTGLPDGESGVFAHDFGFSMVLGGGLDMNIHRHVALRVLQADLSLEQRNWIDEQFTPSIPQLPGSGNWQVRPRISCGIVIKIGAHGNSP
jgi:hypothetical protein